VPGVRPSQMGRAARGIVPTPAAADSGPPRTSGAGLELLSLHGRGCGGASSPGNPARRIHMVHAVYVGDQASELDQHPRQSRNGGRRRGRRLVGRCGCEHHAADLRRLACRACPGGPARRPQLPPCLRSPDKRRDISPESGGRPGYDRRHIRGCEAVPDLHSAVGLRVVPVPAAAIARNVEIPLVQAVELA
jgi:hypothetical protein